MLTCCWKISAYQAKGRGETFTLLLENACQRLCFLCLFHELYDKYVTLTKLLVKLLMFFLHQKPLSLELQGIACFKAIDGDIRRNCLRMVLWHDSTASSWKLITFSVQNNGAPESILQKLIILIVEKAYEELFCSS